MDNPPPNQPTEAHKSSKKRKQAQPIPEVFTFETFKSVFSDNGINEDDQKKIFDNLDDMRSKIILDSRQQFLIGEDFSFANLSERVKKIVRARTLTPLVRNVMALDEIMQQGEIVGIIDDQINADSNNKKDYVQTQISYSTLIINHQYNLFFFSHQSRTEGMI
jgi:hypothetical protein